MKKKLLRTAATLMMVAGALSFAACNSDSNNDDDKAVIDLVDPATTVVTPASIKANGNAIWMYDDDNETFVALTGDDIDDGTCTGINVGDDWTSPADCFSAGTCSVVDSKLHINLGAPKSNAPGFVSIADQDLTSAASPSDAKLFIFSSFKMETTGGEIFYLFLAKATTKQVLFMYADKPITFSGTIERGTFNGNLQAGWNTILRTINDPNPNVEDDETYSYTNCTLGTDYKWGVTAGS